MDTRLSRSRDDRMLGGVAGGLADYLGVDPSLVRIGWVLLFLAGGIGLLLYIVMWIVVPEEDDLSPEELAAARAATGAGGPAPAGTMTSGTSVDWRTQRAAERDARRTARQARRAANPAAGRTAALVVGGLLVLVGAGFLLRDLIPAFDFDYVWPLILVILGVLVLVAAFRPGGLGGSGSGGQPVSGGRRGPILAGTWLIGLGIVFFLEGALGLGWGEAWPMFIILAGVASLVRTALDGIRGFGGIWALTWPVVVILVGFGLLASTTGWLGEGPIATLAAWWPIGLVILGVWFVIGALIPLGGAEEHLAVPLGDAATANVRLRFGAGQLTTGRAQPGNLVDGSFAGGVVPRHDGPGRIELRQDTAYGLPWLDRRSDWQIGLTGDVPLALRLDTGAANARLDLLDLQVRSVELHTGASETHIRLPRAAGMTTVRAESGAASLVIEVPEGVAARIRSRMGLGSSQVDERRFPRSAAGFESPDYGTAANRADIDISGGVGSVRVEGVAV